MSRISTWRRAPGDPTTLRGWLFGSGPFFPVLPPTTGKLADRKTQRRIGHFLTAYVVFGVVMIFGFPDIGKHVLPVVNICLAVVNVVRIYLKPKTTVDEGQGPGESVLVTLSVANEKGRTTGKDRGRLISSEGWLLFEGERTAFALTRRDANVPRFGAAGVVNLVDRRSVRLISPDAAILDRVLTDWSLSPVPDGEPILPPVDRHPEVWVERWIGCIIGLIACVTLSGMALAFGFPLGAASTLLPAGGLAWGARLLSRRLRQELPRVLGAASPLEPWPDRPRLVSHTPDLPSEAGEDR